MASVVPGYSGKPLAAKLGIVDGMMVLAANAPAEYAGWVAPLPPDARLITRYAAGLHFVHLFATERSKLASAFADYRKRLPDDAVLCSAFRFRNQSLASGSSLLLTSTRRQYQGVDFLSHMRRPIAVRFGVVVQPSAHHRRTGVSVLLQVQL